MKRFLVILFFIYSHHSFGSCKTFIDKERFTQSEVKSLENTLKRQNFILTNKIEDADIVFNNTEKWVRHYQDTYIIVSFNTGILYSFKGDKKGSLNPNIPNLEGTTTNINLSDDRAFIGWVGGFFWNQKNGFEKAFSEALDLIGECK
ncbi:MAG: hypothetical protein ACXVCR_09855 [Bdellovibrio sp.]